METIERIAKLLVEKNISQRDLAIAIKIPEQKITDWKAGRTKTYYKYIPQIADFLNVSADYLLGNTEQKNKPAANTGNERDDKILNMFSLMTPEEQDKALEYFEFVTSRRKSNSNNQ